MQISTQELLRRITDYVKSDEMRGHQSAYQGTDPNDTSQLEELIAKLNLVWKVDDELTIRSHRRVLGKFIVILKRLIRKSVYWYLHPFKQSQTLFNMYSVQVINELRNGLIRALGTLISDKEALASISSDVQNLKIEFSKFQNGTGLRLNEDIQELKKDMQILNEELISEMHKLKRERDTYKRSYEESLKAIGEQLESLSSVQEITAARVWRLKEQRNHLTSESGVKTTGAVEVSVPKFDYLTFEAKYRGSFELIKQRQERYLEDIASLNDIVDVGCGRGEFLALMTQLGKNVTGVEINEDMYSIARSKGLPVKLGDGIEYLSTREDGSLGVIFCAHVVEHLDFDKLNRFVELSAKKLKSGGKLIIESPNPTTLMIFANTFYMDPTHIRPVHPETLGFMLREVGFQSVRRDETEPATDWYLPDIEQEESVIRNLGEINEGIHRINRLLFGPQDYALIATR